ncbi:MAG: hypothetical protein JF606_26225 [Burkholderiales bacterium]|nr:hypothetical protein [Burkholderiales bacterium]
MKAMLIGALLAAAAAATPAQDVSARLDASHDSDGFDEQQATLAWTGAAGWGLKAGALHYSAPGWTADGRLLAATYRHKVSGALVEASAGMAKIGTHVHAVGVLDVLRPVAAASSLGVSAERNVVDSRLGIDAGLTFNSLALVADHAFNERFNVGLAGGSSWFSDDNRRPFLRTRWNFSFNEKFGLNAYLKTRSYRDSMPNRAEYFSPERLNETSLGLSSRLIAAQRVVLSAAIDAGRQHTETDAKPIWSYSLGVSSLRNASLRWSLVLQAANTGPLVSRAGDYRYTSLVGQVSFPF